MTRVLGVVIGNQLFDASGFLLNEPAKEASREVTVSEPIRALPPASLQPALPMDAVDEIVTLLARATKLAQTLSADDQRRVREFFNAATSVLHATTRLPRQDQSLFENALRDRQ